MTPAPPEGLSDAGRAAWTELFGAPIAHRGLWSTKAPENTLSALADAMEAGYGVEFDVRLSSDGVPVVFHDEDLSRMTAENGRLEDCTARDLSLTRVGGLETIPTLGEAIGVVNGRRLALVELKPAGDPDYLVERTLDLLEDYQAPFALISSDPAVHASLVRRRPDVLRGVHIAASDKEAQAAQTVQAHFILPALDALRRPATLALRKAGAPAIAWTSRTPREHARALEWADNVIFEGFRP